MRSSFRLIRMALNREKKAFSRALLKVSSGSSRLRSCFSISFSIPFLYLDKKMIERIDNARVPVFGPPFPVVAVQMYVAVNQEPRLEGLHEPDESPKTAMTPVLTVVNPLRRSVRDKHVQETAVDQPVPEKRRDKPEHIEEHPPVGKLVQSPVVTHTAAQTGEKNPVHEPHP